jgi:hypothetical protein
MDSFRARSVAKNSLEIFWGAATRDASARGRRKNDDRDRRLLM